MGSERRGVRNQCGQCSGNLVDGGGSASPVGQREGISFMERVIATRSQQDLGDYVKASGCDLDRGPASQNGKPCRIPACY